MENEELFIRSLMYADISRALSRNFFRVFCVNTGTNVFVEYIPHENDEKLDIHMRGDDFRKVVHDIVESVYGDDLDTVRTAVTKENILSVLEGDDAFTLDFRMIIDGKATYVRMKAVRIRQEDPFHVLIAISNTDAHMQRIAMYERVMQNSLTYAGIAEALASEYVCIYYVNSKSGEFIEYKSSDKYKSFGFAPAGEDFFETCRKDFINVVHPEDRDVFLQAFEKDNLLKVLSVDRLFLLTFRVLFEGEPIYVRMKITKMAAEDNHHIVVGLSNIDASVRRTAKYEHMKEIANRDPLTGVKSKHAFTVAEESIDKEIEEDRAEQFAVAVCDVNGLKQINDTLGHKAGDRYIKEACALVCKVFKHSPVFRIGGDEFVVLMKGHDYEKRSELIGTINHEVEKNNTSGGVVISVGISDFIPGEDKDIEAVFERADALMYKRKAQLKSSAKS
ncbi:MAG: GGDEF domain-containing protein [Lachnospiraceae bacterium]|nr:GGDEF domain-containing protein [Lachnospiraceae bacterium]